MQIGSQFFSFVMMEMASASHLIDAQIQHNSQMGQMSLILGLEMNLKLVTIWSFVVILKTL